MMRPRTGVGDVSERYTGTTLAAMPTPRPIIIRPNTKIPTELAHASSTAPRIKRISERRIAGLRPQRSEKQPPKRAPRAAPRVRILVTS